MLAITHEKEEVRLEDNVSCFIHKLYRYLLFNRSITCIPNGHCHCNEVKVKSRLTQSNSKQINREGKDGYYKIILYLGRYNILGLIKNKYFMLRLWVMWVTSYLFYHDASQ